MNLNEKYYVIEKMALLIDLGITGNSNDFAHKLGISRSQLFIELDELKSLDVDIRYSRSKQSFVFSGNKKIFVREPIIVVENDELTFINGGFFNEKSSVHFFGRYSFNLTLENFQ